MVLDKTGTITQGKPQVTDILPNKRTEEELLQVAAALEEKSEHPLAEAILERAGAQGIKAARAENFLAISAGACRQR